MKRKLGSTVSLKIVDAASRKYWFTIWPEHNQKWGEVMATEEFKKSLCDTDENVEAWLTEAQWADLYKSPDIAAQIKKKQSMDNEIVSTFE